MDATSGRRFSGCHVVAMPYPGRGHINPMMNLCKSLASRTSLNVLITFVLTEEWLGFIGADDKPPNIRFDSIPNIIPSELVRAADFAGFIDAVWTKMEAPFERLLDRLDPTPTVILADTTLVWALDVGNRRKIPLASFWPMAASVFSVFHHFDLLVQHRHFPIHSSEIGQRKDEIVDYIPGMSPTRVADLPTIIHGISEPTLRRALDSVVRLDHKAQYLLLSSIHELEAPIVDAIQAKFSKPVYCVGPLIPYPKLITPNISAAQSNGGNDPNNHVMSWLDSQPRGSVLYVSWGSFLSLSGPQMEEIAAGLSGSGVRYLRVARGEAHRLEEGAGDKGLVVGWCDQLRVLSHCAVGGFWTHCGWNSTMEGVFAGVPLLTFPVAMDQVPNSKVIVEDWKVGQRARKERGAGDLVERGEVAEVVRRFMDSESCERREMVRRVKELQDICQKATAEGGSFDTSLDAFARDISRSH
ncbi:UDP-glycosyltransferase 87A1-like [Malania oleifera]|uniref:UDP-glycosyltransferase 87A1-like n=1 Tax=Malania oleifera TaxID=397392 RepID=UPI0025ADD8D4|nr:UDP-glycosyltransferase 87A1-like [Malania oleifera]